MSSCKKEKSLDPWYRNNFFPHTFFPPLGFTRKKNVLLMKKIYIFHSVPHTEKNNVLVKFSLSGYSNRKIKFFPRECFFSTWIALSSHRKKQLFPGDFFCPLGKTQENKLFPHEQKYIFSLSSLNRKKKNVHMNYFLLGSSHRITVLFFSS